MYLKVYIQNQTGNNKYKSKIYYSEQIKVRYKWIVIKQYLEILQVLQGLNDYNKYRITNVWIRRSRLSVLNLMNCLYYSNSK